jgi:multidrug efflux system membrane fusion protein
VPEQYLPEIRRRWAADSLKVKASLRDGTEGSLEGELSFIDNAVDPTTGTIRLKATFANEDHTLWPGQFVDAALLLTFQRDALVVPSHAIQTGQKGPFVFSVKPDMTVEARPVEVGRTVGGETVVARGLAPGERVVTDGQLRLFPGARVEVRDGEPGRKPAS